jgi:hypothetical protein
MSTTSLDLVLVSISLLRSDFPSILDNSNHDAIDGDPHCSYGEPSTPELTDHIAKQPSDNFEIRFSFSPASSSLR